ncbi:hypothetical protein ACFV9P_27650 [Streptomyces sp. NPDC059892]|uniref:hypothetical protein n=1 Tax=Streptomyces sp. NPDC059892 TaxID=3346989 RepID=UPI00365A769C
MGKRIENSMTDTNATTVVQAGDIGVFIQNASAPVHTGSGDQIINTGSEPSPSGSDTTAR